MLIKTASITINILACLNLYMRRPGHLFFSDGGRERKVVDGIKLSKKSGISFFVAFQ